MLNQLDYFKNKKMNRNILEELDSGKIKNEIVSKEVFDEHAYPLPYNRRNGFKAH